MKKTVEGVTDHKEDPIAFLQEMEDLQRFYYLNGVIIEQINRAKIIFYWHKVVGDWNPWQQNDQGQNNGALAHDSDELTKRVEALRHRITQKCRVNEQSSPRKDKAE